MTDVAELRRLAEAATPGPWDCYRPHPAYRAYSVDQVMPEGHLGETVAVTEDTNADANGLYIAAANPAAVLALLDAAAERDALAAKVERVRALPAKHPAGGWYMTSMRDVLAALDEEPQP